MTAKDVTPIVERFIKPMTLNRLFWQLGVLLSVSFLAACGVSEPPTRGGPPTVRLLSEQQYRNTIAEIFGPQIVVAARLDPIVRVEGLLAIGASRATVTPSAVERYVSLARSIATQVVSPPHRDILLPCQPQDASIADDACARQFLEQVGRYLFRRTLSEQELASYVALASQATELRGDFHAGLALGLQAMLASPEFLFITENVERQADDSWRLDAYSKASRLSLFLWNSTPDEALLAAAESGELHTRRGLERQVDRMMQSPRLEIGMRAFFADMLALENFDTLEKDSSLYPAFLPTVAQEAREQILRTLVDLLLNREGDYRDIFTHRSTFMTGALGVVYQVPVASPSQGWSPYEFPEDDPRSGIQSLLGFSALHSHPGKSSPTLRGKAVRELLLCQRVPDPPGSVNFDLFNDPQSSDKTARDKLLRHSTDPSCSGCHKLMDPIGLALENFDGAGQFRLQEAGLVIDVSGEINGVEFADIRGLGEALRDDPAAPACLVRRLYTFAAGRPVQRSERKLLNYFEDEFVSGDYRLRDLLEQIALSDALYAVKPPVVQIAQRSEEEGGL